MANRRDFLKAAAASAVLSVAPAAQAVFGAGARSEGLDLMRAPDSLSARFGPRQVVKMQYAAAMWTCPDVVVSAEPVEAGRARELPVRVNHAGRTLTFLHLRWKGRQSEAMLSVGDAWERSYGDLAWQGTVPERVMPWYFLTFDGKRVNGYGVKTQPSAFCFWQRDTEGVTLSIDLRNGGEPTELGARELHACTVVTRMGANGETIFRAGQEFCRRMSPLPRLPREPILGANDWNYAYGKNTASGILRDADLVASLAPAGRVRPHLVVDDGWQDTNRFPSMPDLASQIRDRQLRPGLWIRPLRAGSAAPASWLLPDARFGKTSPHENLAFDPTHPEALEEALKTVRTAVQWGYEFVKHDFTTYELFGRWGFAMHAEITGSGWHFQDRSRTNAEIVRDLYQSIRSAAGETTTVLGCNTVGHLAAGLFESQRIADDTSGRDWERTRRYGVNGLAHRIVQHRTFSFADPDCVAITADVSWKETSQWMDVVARSGTSLFLSPEPSAVTPEIKSAMKDAMLLASHGASGYPVDPTRGTTPIDWQFTAPDRVQKTYDWSDPDGVSPFEV